MKSICICGGGNLGHVCAGYISAKGEYCVNILTGHPDAWSRELSIVDLNGKRFDGRINKISDNPELVIPSADIVLICVPGYAIYDEINKIKPFLSKEAFVGSVVSSTGFFFQAHKLFSDEQPLFGFQRVPFISRISEYGHSASILGYKPKLTMAVENCRDVEGFRKDIADIFDTEIALAGNFYEVSLTNSNPLLHTSRLYTMWHEYKSGITYLRVTAFYSEWTDAASELLIAMDEEFQALLARLDITPGVIPSILDYYESVDAKSLTEKIRSITAFKGLLSPMAKSERGYIPDFSSRYFTEDFPYGLRFIHDLAHDKKVPTPNIDRVFNWGMSVISADCD